MLLWMVTDWEVWRLTRLSSRRRAPRGESGSGDSRVRGPPVGVKVFSCAGVEAVAEAPGFGAGVDDVGAVGETVDDGFGHPGVGEYLGPLAEREVGGHDQRPAFVALRENLEDEFGGADSGRVR